VNPEDLDELFRTYCHSAWRFECRDDYAVPGEDADFDDFLAGRPVAPRTIENNTYLANIARQRQEGKYFGRVRTVGHPITRYTEFEMASYPENIAAGEEVQILDRSWLEPGNDDWTRQDFWLFDDAIAVLMNYDDQGHFLGVERAEDVQPYIAIRRRATQLSVPFASYRLVPPPRVSSDDRTRAGVLE
jgi:hypothetical protein